MSPPLPPTAGARPSPDSNPASLEASLKSREVEELIDLGFYRPLGFVIARALSRTAVRPNHVTFVSIFLGVAAGHLLYYRHAGFTVAAILAFVVANLLDSVDGQLARLTGFQTHLGRVLDGIAGALMFTSIYVHLGLRQYAGGDGIAVMALALLALYAQAVQNSVADCLLNAYLTYGLRKTGYELDDLAEIRRQAKDSRNRLLGPLLRLYASYLATQERLTPALQQLRRALAQPLTATVRARVSSTYRRVNHAVVQQRAWIATNIRMAVLFAAVLADRVLWFFWINIIVLSVVMLVLIALHERNCRSLLPLAAAEGPSPPTRS